MGNGEWGMGTMTHILTGVATTGVPLATRFLLKLGNLPTQVSSLMPHDVSRRESV